MKEKQREFEFTMNDFDNLRKLSNQHSGIVVPDDKFDMFYSRLSKRLRILRLSSFKEYCMYLNNRPDTEFTEFINAITTNLTSFFREKHHYDYLENILLPELLIKNSATKTIRVWSAGCSTGEEAYSLAITLMENVPQDWKLKILATDLDTNVLQTASDGIYTMEKVNGLPSKILKKWFKRGKENNAFKVKMNPDLQKLILFKQLNLIKEWPFKNRFDFIFCRNVLIYFDTETKSSLAKRYGSLLEMGSHLFIGHSESLHQLNTGFDLVGNTIYKKDNAL